MITTQDKELLAKKGITEAQIAEQLACFQTGFPYLKLDAAASIERGILAPNAEEQKAYLAAWDAYTNTDKTIVKFVPASGAASRMFKNLFEFLSADYDKPTTKFEQAFFAGIKDFAFYDERLGNRAALAVFTSICVLSAVTRFLRIVIFCSKA